jgi:MraZ protein
VRISPDRTDATEAGPALLTGTHPCKLEEGRRLELPATVRAQLGEVRVLYLTPGLDPCLMLHKGSAMLASQEGVSRDVRRLHFSRTEKVSVDAEGRCSIPSHLARLAGLEGDMVVIGVGEHLELWDAKHWERYLEQSVGSGRPH